jgi:ADP-ribose pyrophosphatase YjhB (NUDIX family)
MEDIWKPRVTVAAVLERDGRFLMVEERVAGKLVYNQPAGHLEDDEGLIAAVVRETLEETAWHFQPEALSGIYRWRHPRRQETWLRVAFAGTGLYHEPERALDADIERILWLTPGEIRARRGSLRSPMVLRCLDDYLAGQSAPLALLVDIE